MSRIFRFVLVLVFASVCGPVLAQQNVWVQIEAQPSLGQARDRAATYGRRIDNVAGFRLGSTNWYAIAVGPFDADGAARTRARLRGAGAIPGDAFVTDGAAYRDRFWPDGDAVVSEPIAPVAEAPENSILVEPAAQPDPEETVAEARRSEAALFEDERKLLQVALQWEGFYNAAIDGAFGRGTRSAMAAWQAAQGVDTTGVLTTRQRALLLERYNAILAGLGMERVRDTTAGIEMLLPLAVVEFDRYEPPFAHYSPSDANATVPKVLLISQRGNTDTLFGLYDIMQTLEIVPEQGAREKQGNSFTLIGEGADFVSHTEASAQNGAVKGFTLIWPRGDETRRARVLDAMKRSFTALPGTVMGDLVGEPTEDQRIDLLAGLEVRRPATSRSGFYVDPRGTILTAASGVEQCTRITLNEEIEAEVSALDAGAGLALLKPKQALAPRTYARFQPSVPRLQSEVVLAGYSYDGVLGAPSLTFGKLADLRGLNGEEDVKRLELTAQPGDAGGPVLDVTGAVLGILVPGRAPAGRALPEGVSFLADVEVIANFMSANGLSAAASESRTELRAGSLSDLATEMTVLVSCWQ